MFRLAPSEIYFSQDSISNHFGNYTPHRYKTIGETLDDILSGKCEIYGLPTISVIKKNGLWVSADNRRLWVYKKLQEFGKCDSIPVVVTYRLNPSKSCIRSYIIVRGHEGGTIWRTLKREQRTESCFSIQENPNSSIRGTPQSLQRETSIHAIARPVENHSISKTSLDTHLRTSSYGESFIGRVSQFGTDDIGQSTNTSTSSSAEQTAMAHSHLTNSGNRVYKSSWESETPTVQSSKTSYTSQTSSACVIRRTRENVLSRKRPFTSGNKQSSTQEYDSQESDNSSSTIVNGSSHMGLDTSMQSPRPSRMRLDTPMQSSRSSEIGLNTHIQSSKSSITGQDTPFQSPRSSGMGLGTRMQSPRSSGMGLGTRIQSPRSSGMGLGTRMQSPRSSGMGLGTRMQSPRSSGMGLGTRMQSPRSSEMGLGTHIQSPRSSGKGLYTSIQSPRSSGMGLDTSKRSSSYQDKVIANLKPLDVGYANCVSFDGKQIGEYLDKYLPKALDRTLTFSLKVFQYQEKYYSEENLKLWIIQSLYRFTGNIKISGDLVAQPAIGARFYDSLRSLCKVEGIFRKIGPMLINLPTKKAKMLNLSDIFYSRKHISDTYQGKSIMKSVIDVYSAKTHNMELNVVEYNNKFYALENQRLWVLKQAKIVLEALTITGNVKVCMDSIMFQSFTDDNIRDVDIIQSGFGHTREEMFMIEYIKKMHSRKV